MNTKNILFILRTIGKKPKNIIKPEPMINNTTKWYKDADKFVKDQYTGEYVEDKFLGGKIPTFKSCPAFFDAMTSGYTLLTPCDIEIVSKNNEKVIINILDKDYINFCTSREEISQFLVPDGYNKNHLSWLPEWSIELPEGYSALYLSPLNRFDLPFITMSGIVDNDKLVQNGFIPFFIKNNFSGIIKRGTPYLQIFPFLRENWIAEYNDSNEGSIKKIEEYNKKYKVKDGGVYKNNIWERRRYRG